MEGRRVLFEDVGLVSNDEYHIYCKDVSVELEERIASLRKVRCPVSGPYKSSSDELSIRTPRGEWITLEELEKLYLKETHD